MNHSEPQEPVPCLTFNPPLAPRLSRDDGAGETAGSGWSGVARIHDGQISGSGVLLESGLHLLTVAHLVDELLVAHGAVTFETASGPASRAILAVEDYPGALLNSEGVWHDLALLTLTQAAPAEAERYRLYAGSDELGQTATLVGYGQAQDTRGNPLPENGDTRRSGENTVDAIGTSLAWYGWRGTLEEQLFYDYDDGSKARDSLGDMLGVVNLGLGGQEAMITPGDSGGGLFIEEAGNWRLAGIHSYVTRWAPTDLNSVADGSLGDLGVATRVGAYRDWLAAKTGEQQTPLASGAPPPTVAEVPLQVAEGEGAWFLVSLARAASQEATVDFATRDGSAVAGQDYIPSHGTITLALNQWFAKVWVQTLADDRSEGDETFSLVLSNPHGASFSAGLAELSAQRTILDDPTLTGTTLLVAALFG